MATIGLHHFCSRFGFETVSGSSPCYYCGSTTGTPALSLSHIEAMAAYSWRTGLKPIGPHRRLADKLLKAITSRPCDACAGVGAHLDIRAGTVETCKVCLLSGKVPGRDSPEMKKLRAAVLKKFPDAAAGD